MENWKYNCETNFFLLKFDTIMFIFWKYGMKKSYSSLLYCTVREDTVLKYRSLCIEKIWKNIASAVPYRYRTVQVTNNLKQQKQIHEIRRIRFFAIFWSLNFSQFWCKLPYVSIRIVCIFVCTISQLKSSI